MQEEFVPGSARAKLIYFGLLLLGIALLFLLDPVFEFLESKNETLAEKNPAQALANSIQQLLVITIISATAMCGVAFYCFRLGLRAKKSGRWPPPGMRMVFRTKVRRGLHAKIMWVLLFIAAGALVINSFVKIYAWYAVSQLTKELISPTVS